MFVRMNGKYNKVITGGLLTCLLIAGCADSENDENSSVNSEPEVVHATIDTAELQGSYRSTEFEPRISPRELLENFNYCRDNAETEFTCKYFIAKAISEYYGIDDFKETDTYVDFEKIRPLVENSGEWEKLGPANNQDVLEKAQIQANKGIATIGIFTGDNYGHVVLILKGNLGKAKNWDGLMVPNCASFFMVSNLEPFINKSMAYAFSSPESVYLYTKNN